MAKIYIAGQIVIARVYCGTKDDEPQFIVIEGKKLLEGRDWTYLRRV